MKSFTDQFISDGYKSLLHTEADSLSSSSETIIYDGQGNASSLSLGVSGTTAKIDGTLEITNGATISGNLTSGNVVYPSVSELITFFDLIYPIGSLFLTTGSTNPNDQFVGTNWELVSEGKFLAGVGTGTDDQSNQVTISSGDNTGLYSITLSASQVPDHYHFIANTTSDHSAGTTVLNSDNYLQQGGTLFTSMYAYELEGNEDPATVGRTSGVVGASASPITLTPPSFGAYIWKRTS